MPALASITRIKRGNMDMKCEWPGCKGEGDEGGYGMRRSHFCYEHQRLCAAIFEEGRQG